MRRLSESFSDFIEINFERTPEAKKLFQGDISGPALIASLEAYFSKKIVPGRTLLFLDEIQECPEAIKSLRYFFEDVPALHVVGAGSLLEFQLNKIGVSVGRVQFLHVFPLSFREFAGALGEREFLDHVSAHDPGKPINPALHEKGLGLVKLYTALGGMPEVVRDYLQRRDLARCQDIQQQLLNTYRQDIQKYARLARVPHVEDVLNAVPRHLGEKFVYRKVRDDVRALYLAEALNLLTAAGVIHRVCHSSCNGVPMGAEADRRRFKAIFFDVGLAQRILGLTFSSWVLEPPVRAIHRGGLAEQLVGQELIAAGDPGSPPELYYWHRESRTSSAEVDYVVERDGRLIPVEVKAGALGKLRSLQLFLSEKPQHLMGIKVSEDQFSIQGRIHSIPFYAFALHLGGKRRQPS